MATLQIVLDEIVPEREFPAAIGEMETKASRKDRVMITRRREYGEPNVLMAAAMNLGM